MQLKAGIVSALVAASAVSATPIDNNSGLTQKHQVIQHGGQTCITQHQVNACTSGYVPKYYRKANMPFVCREQFSQDTIERAESGEQIEEFKNEQPTQYMQRNVPRACISNDQDAQNDQDEQDQQQRGRRNWQPFRGARTGKQQQMSEQDAREFEHELNEKFSKNHVQYQVNENSDLQQQQQQEQQQQMPEQQRRQQAKQAIRNKWAQLPLHRMMKMSDNEVAKVEYQLRQLIANQPQVANWVFKYDQQLPKLYSKLVETLAEDIMQPYLTEDEKLRQMVQHQITNAASRVYTWMVKQMVVERDEYRRQNKQNGGERNDENTDDDQYDDKQGQQGQQGQQNQQDAQKQQQTWELEDVPEFEEITKRVWEAAQRELHNSEIENTKQTLNNFFEHTKQDRPEQYQKMFKTFEQHNLNTQESQRIAKKLLQLVIAGIQISAPEHPSFEQQQQQNQAGDEQQLQRYHAINQFTEEQLSEAENKLRSAVNQDWADFADNNNNGKETNDYENWSDEQENEYQQQQQQQQLQQQQQQNGFANGLFGKLKVIFQRFEKNIRGQSNNNNYNNNQDN